jgi:hypothetical protein
MVLVNTPVAGKPQAKVGGQSNFVSVALPTAEGNGADDSRRVFHQENKVQYRVICDHGGLRRLISTRLADNVAKFLG